MRCSEGTSSDPPAAVRVTYLGHATLLFEAGGEAILTDPVFSRRIAHIFTKRSSPSTFHPEELRGLTAVLISHAHHDHLDYTSLGRLGRHHPILVPWGVKSSLRRRGFTDVRQVRPWDEVAFGRWRITVVPSRHFGGRLPLLYTSGHQGYVLSGPSCIYFAGDTGLDVPLCEEIGRRFVVGLAVLPIAGAMFPWFRRNHMNAADALEAFRALGAARMIPMHFETYPASFEPAMAARRSLHAESARLGLQERLTVLAEGSSLSLR